jgi:predicted alpha/beta-hydrolase family hydrolase
MSEMHAEEVTIQVDETRRVSGLLLRPPAALACYVFAHGAGAGMEHPSMRVMAEELAQRQVATLRYQFPYMEQRSRRPDPPALCHRTVRAAVTEAARLTPGVPLYAGGRSFGGRMTSQAQAAAPLAGVGGLIFLGFPLHPAGRPATERARHLFDVHIPMLFVQGTRDELAHLELLEPLIRELGAHATLKALADADHSFHVPARSGKKDPDIRREALTTVADWIEGLSG